MAVALAASHALAAPARPARGLPPMRRTPLAPAAPRRQPSSRAWATTSTYEVGALEVAQARIDAWVTQLSGAAAGTASRLRGCLLGLLMLVQRTLRWLQLAAVALQLQRSAQQLQEQQQQQQQQQQLAFAGAGGSGDAAAAPAAPVAPAPADAVIGFLSGATTGAVEQLRQTLNDAGQGIESKMSAIERTAGGLHATLFAAAQSHSEAVRSNPERNLWKQPNVEELVNEEEQLRRAVFAQVFAELAQKDTESMSFKASGP